MGLVRVEKDNTSSPFECYTVISVVFDPIDFLDNLARLNRGENNAVIFSMLLLSLLSPILHLCPWFLDPNTGICMCSSETLCCSEVYDGNRGIYVSRETSVGCFPISWRREIRKRGRSFKKERGLLGKEA